jgi:hypothetical protein
VYPSRVGPAVVPRLKAYNGHPRSTTVKVR